MTFPHARAHPSVRRRPAAVLAAAAVSGVLTAAVLPAVVPPTPATASTPRVAGSLEDKRDAVRDRLEDATHQLEESSAAVRRAGTALLQARVDLADAEAVLAATRDELAVARARDREMRARLEAAQARLARARDALAVGRAAAEEQAQALRGMAAAGYEQGGTGLAGLSVVFTTQDPSQLAGRLNASANVLNSESALLDRLTASRILLTVQEEEHEAAEAQVAERREEAAANLARKEELEAQAAAATARVGELVQVLAAARRSALAAEEADLRQLGRLQAERDRITALILQRAASSALTAVVDGRGYLSPPAPGGITSGYGWRDHPIFGYRALHDGIDIGAACGTPVVAPAGGTVLSTYASDSWGNRVILDHGLQKGVGLATISNHLSSFAVAPGEQVERGEVIGYVGSTGWSTGCHLHFSVLQNGVAVDPAPWL